MIEVARWIKAALFVQKGLMFARCGALLFFGQNSTFFYFSTINKYYEDYQREL